MKRLLLIFPALLLLLFLPDISEADAAADSTELRPLAAQRLSLRCARWRAGRCTLYRTRRVRITAIRAYDAGTHGSSGDASTAVDVVQGLCGDPPDQEDEPFFDTVMGVEVENELTTRVRFRKFFYHIQNADGAGNKLRSSKMALIGEREVDPNGERKELYGLFTDVQSGAKYFVGATSAIPSTLGFKNVTAYLVGKIGTGPRIRVKARTALSFDNFNRCDN